MGINKPFGKFTNIILWIVAGLVLATFYFVSRLPNLTLIPIFTDEAIYLRWTQVALSDPRWRFISLIDGKQPLLIWLFLPVVKYMNDPLVAGRLVSVVLGFTGMVGMAIFGKYLTRSIKGAIVGGLLYLIIPIFVAYDRMALYEALLTTETVWMLFLSYLLGKTLRLDVALLLGTVVGMGLLTKSSANFFWILLPVTLLLVDWKKSKLRIFIKWLGLIAVVIAQSQVYNSILRLSEFRHYIRLKNLEFIYSFSEILGDPFAHVVGNLTGLSRWFFEYMMLPLSILIVISVIWYIGKNYKTGFFFLAYFFIPFISTAVFGKIIYPRFLIFMIVPLLIPVTLFITSHWGKIISWKALVIIAFVFMPNLYFDYKLLFDPIHAPWPLADKHQFIDDWPSGYGIKEVVTYLKEETKKGHVVVGTEGTFGLFPMALELYFAKDTNMTFKAYWPLSDVPKELRDISKSQPTFLVLKERQDVPTGWSVKLIAQYRRGDGPTFLKFYRVLP